MKEYKLEIDPRVLELLGPSLYTNIYYVLAELIANAYDADAHNVYIMANPDDITVEPLMLLVSPMSIRLLMRKLQRTSPTLYLKRIRLSVHGE